MIFLFNSTQGENSSQSLLVAYGLVEQIVYVYELYINCFLVYLIRRFAVENKNAEVRDPILGKEVPNLVFLQNQKLLKEALKDKLELDKREKKNLILQAQKTEYMHNMLRQIGIADLLDEQIGTQFIDNHRSRVYTDEFNVGNTSESGAIAIDFSGETFDKLRLDVEPNAEPESI